MRLGAKIYAVSIICSGALALAFSLTQWHPQDYGLFTTLLLFGIVGSQTKVRIPGYLGTLTAALLVAFIALLELSLAETVVVALVSATAQTYLRTQKRPTVLQLAFNLATVSIAVTGSIFTYRLLQQNNALFGLPLILAAVGSIYFILNSAPVAVILALTGGGEVVSVWRTSYFWSFPFYLAGAGVAGMLHAMSKSYGWQTAFLILPLFYAFYKAYQVFTGRLEDGRRHAEELAALQLRSIHTLALAVETKDDTTYAHLHRVQTYAMGIGAELGLSQDEMRALQAASILHDVGKLAVPEYIISKPGKLTAEEFEKMKLHTVVGGEIASKMDFPYPVAPIVRAHHEKWNGTGYPDGLREEAIPIGARILAAVDCLDALATDRQYRRALPLHEAMEIVRRESGSAFDPRVVEVLSRLYSELEIRAHASFDATKKLAIDSKVNAGNAPDAGLEVSAPPERSTTFPTDRFGVLQATMSVRSEISSLLEDARSLSSGLRDNYLAYALSMRLQPLIPHDTLALFAKSGESLVARAAYGQDSALLNTLVIPAGQGLAGWVAHNKKPILNGNPAVEPGAERWTQPSVLQAALATPLATSESLLGVLGLYSRAKDAFQRDHLHVLDLLTPRLVDVLRVLASKPSSVQYCHSQGGYPDGRAFFTDLEDLLKRSSTEHDPLILLRLDLDSLPSAARILGQSAADLLAFECESAIRAAFPFTHRIARLNCCEFAILTRSPGLRNTMEQLGWLRARLVGLARERFGLGDFTAHFGLAETDKDGWSIEALLAAAEQSLAETRQNVTSASLLNLSKTASDISCRDGLTTASAC